MKIKLQEYSLINNECIDDEIKILANKRDSYPIDSGSWTICDVRITVLRNIKQQLIPSEKLASAVYEQCTVIGTALSFREQEAHKPIYLKSEIEL